MIGQEESQRVLQRIHVLNTSEPYHNERYKQSLEWIAQFVDKQSTRILDLGGSSPFSEALRLEGYNIQLTPGDLRETWSLPDKSFDLLLCMEVLEHVKDKKDDADVATFTGSGIQNMFAESHRVLVSGGSLFLTTPNVCGYRSLLNLLNDRHPFFYPLHHRELCETDVIAYSSQNGFELVSHAHRVVWNHHKIRPRRIRHLTRMCRDFGFRADRGDDLFFLFKAR